MSEESKESEKEEKWEWKKKWMEENKKKTEKIEEEKEKLKKKKEEWKNETMEEEERKFIEKLEGMEKGNSIEKMFENIWEYTKILRNTNKKGKQKKREIREKIINKGERKG